MSPEFQSNMDEPFISIHYKQTHAHTNTTSEDDVSVIGKMLINPHPKNLVNIL